MQFEEKYQLGEVIANDTESKTFRARELAAGRDVLVHLLFGGRGPQGQEPILSSLLQRMVDPSPERRRPILEISDYKGMPYVVTDLLPAFRTLRQWVDQDRPPQAEPPAPAESARLSRAGRWRVPALEGTQAPPVVQAPPPPPSAAKPQGEFTRLFRVTVGDTQKLQVPRPAAEAPVAPAPPAPSPAPAAAPASPGAEASHDEFARLFQQPPGDSAPAPPAPSPVPAAAPASPGAEASRDEFARLFQQPLGDSAPPAEQPAAKAPSAPAPPAPAPVPAAAPAPPGAEASRDEFARLFQQPLGDSAPPPAQPPVEAPAAPPAAEPGPGEFTRLFHQPLGSSAALPAEPPATAGPGEFTRLFQQPLGSGAMPERAAPDAGDFERLFEQPLEEKPSLPQAPAPPPVPGAKPPGEFTRLFHAMGDAPPAPAMPAPPGQPPGGALESWFQPPPAAGRPTPVLGDAGPASAPPSGGPGEFTRLFGTPTRTGDSPLQPPGAPPPPAQSRATGVFSAARTAPAPPQPAAGGPGEYTRLFGSPVSGGAPGAPPAPVAGPAATPPMAGLEGISPMSPIMAPAPQLPAFQAPAAPKAAAKPSNLPLYLLLGFLALCVLGLVLYFVLKR